MATIIRQIIRRNIIPQIYIPASTATMRLLNNKTGAPTDSVTNKIDATKSDPKKPTIDRKMYDELVRSNKVVAFIKGTPQSPRCGFSNAIVQIFRMHGVEYDAHDVLTNPEIREGIKIYTDWPTIPQVFIDGEFVGGCDILLEMHQNGDLIEQLLKAGIVSELVKVQNEIDAAKGRSEKDPKKN